MSKNYIKVKVDGKMEKLFKEHQIKCPYCGNPLNTIQPIKLDERNNTVTFVASCWSGIIDHEKPRHYFLVKVSHLRKLEFDNELLPYDD